MSAQEPYGVPAAQEPLTAANRPPPRGRPPAPPTPKKKFGGWGFLLTIVIIVVAVAWGLYDARDQDSGEPLGGGLFGTQGAERLVARLDAAAKSQRVCYGWEIDSDRPSISPYSRLRSTPSPLVPSGRPSATPTEGVPTLPALPPPPKRPGVDAGSNLGVDTDPRQDPGQCPKWVVFTADYNYSYADEEWTSVTRGVQTNLPISLSAGDLDAAGITGKDLLGDQADARLADTIGTLPMIVAEKGGGPAVPEAAGRTPPSGDKASSPGLTRYLWIGVAALLIAGGLVWITIAAVRSRRAVGSPGGGRERESS